jgi:GTP cyclohydrolase I
MDKETYQLLLDIDAGRITPEDVRTRVGGYEERMEARCRAINTLLGTIPTEDPSREGLLETPMRVARMYEEIFGGYEMDPRAILNKTFEADGDASDDIYNNGIVAVKEIPFYSHCEHHMVPFIGHAWIAYIPSDRVVGLSKLARVVECFARRLQIQERMTTQIADVIEEVLQPQGVMVVLKAEHLCMAMRGVKKPGTKTVTSCVRGVFVNEAARMEAMSLLELGK